MCVCVCVCVCEVMEIKITLLCDNTPKEMKATCTHYMQKEALISTVNTCFNSYAILCKSAPLTRDNLTGNEIGWIDIKVTPCQAQCDVCTD